MVAPAHEAANMSPLPMSIYRIARTDVSIVEMVMHDLRRCIDMDLGEEVVCQPMNEDYRNASLAQCQHPKLPFRHLKHRCPTGQTLCFTLADASRGSSFADFSPRCLGNARRKSQSGGSGRTPVFTHSN